jgi:hypothetical protein
MDYDVMEARYVGGFVVWLRFHDGTAGEVDLGSRLKGEIFQLLRDPQYFKTFTVHPEFRTLVLAREPLDISSPGSRLRIATVLEPSTKPRNHAVSHHQEPARWPL